jgi:hypothetical protein
VLLPAHAHAQCSLKELDLSCNRLQALPDTAGCAALREYRVCNNSAAAALAVGPAALPAPSVLRLLDLSGSVLAGPIPEAVLQQGALVRWDLGFLLLRVLAHGST